jgi:hypothetical protein
MIAAKKETPRVRVRCLECGRRWSVSPAARTTPQCRGCNSVDVEVASDGAAVTAVDKLRANDERDAKLRAEARALDDWTLGHQIEAIRLQRAKLNAELAELSYKSIAAVAEFIRRNGRMPERF